MPIIPLIPADLNKENHDVLPLLREIFQDFLCQSTYARNICQTLKTSNASELCELTASSLLHEFKRVKKATKEISKVEEQMLHAHALQLIREKQIEDDELLKERTKQITTLNDTEVSAEAANKYGLIRPADFEKPAHEKRIDFRLNKKSKCRDAVEEEYYDGPSKQIACMPEPYEVVTYVPKFREEQSFKVHPEIIVFYDYELNRVYQKHFKLVNISKTTQSFYIKQYPKYKYFKVGALSSSLRVAAGMTIHFAVTFQTDTFLDVHDVVKINGYATSSLDVKLVSFRNSPSLHCYVFKSMGCLANNPIPSHDTMEYDVYRSLALNLVIDCGTCLYGEKIDVNLIMQNEGCSSCFFIVSENEWFNSTITNVNEKMELFLNSFQIFPSYFCIKENEFVEIQIEFHPIDFGLHLENIYFLCDNNTYERVDLIGDAVFFTKSLLTIEANLLSSKFSNQDKEAEYFMYFGPLLPYYRFAEKITVHNTGPVNLKYRWEIRNCSNDNENTELKKIDLSWVQIQQTSGMPANSTTEFSIKVNCQTDDPGLYSFVILLIITDVPEMALTDEQFFDVYEKPQTDVYRAKVLDVIFAEIECQFDIFPYSVDIFPEPFSYPGILSYGEKFQDWIEIKTFGSFTLNCKWLIPDEVKSLVDISPGTFYLDTSNSIRCSLYLKANGYENIDASVILDVENGAYRREIKVFASVEKPNLALSKSYLYPGIIAKGKSVTETFKVKSLSHENIDWILMEMLYDKQEKRFVFLEDLSHISVTRGHFENFDEEEIVTYSYQTTRNMEWMSCLILLSSHPVRTAVNAMCMVNYSVHSVKIRMHTENSEYPILCPSEVLYKDVESYHQVMLHNHGPVTGSFIMGNPMGDNINLLKLKIQPRRGIINPGIGVLIDVIITPKELGIYENIYIPCYIGRTEKPIILRIMIGVDDVSVNFHIPIKDSFRIIRWPPFNAEEFYVQPPLYDESDEYHVPSKEIDLEGCFCEDEKFPVPVCPCPKVKSYYSGVDIIKFLKSRKPAEGEQESLVGYSDLSFPSTKNDDYCPYCPDNLWNYISYNVNYLDEVVECFKVPLRTPVKRVFYIENLTPAQGFVTVKSSNFYPVDQLKGSKYISHLLGNTPSKRCNEWDNIINTDGILVKVTPSTRALGPNEKIPVEIWVYANTWGVYLEEIVVDVNEIIPYAFNLLIEVVGNPIEFPIARNSLLSEPTLRFGAISCKAPSSTRTVNVANLSSIPICVFWHVYEGPADLLPFNLEWHLLRKTPSNLGESGEGNSPSTGSKQTESSSYDGHLLLSNRNLGKKSSLFRINAMESVIQPGKTVPIQVTLSLGHLEPFEVKDEVEATFVGYVYLTKEYSYQPELYRRPSGEDLPPATIKIVANIAFPYLDLEDMQGDLKTELSAGVIIRKGRVQKKLKNYFKNTNSFDIFISVDAEPPFQVLYLRSVNSCEDDRFTEVLLKPDETVEVNLLLDIKRDFVLDLSTSLYSKCGVVLVEQTNVTPNVKAKTVVIYRKLRIHQRNDFIQRVTREILIRFPNMEVTPASLHFATICVGYVKMKLVKIRNTSTETFPFRVCSSMDTEEVVIVKPKEGVLHEKESIQLMVFFKPKAGIFYKETLIISTNIPCFSKNIEIQGWGSTNSRFIPKEDI